MKLARTEKRKRGKIRFRSELWIKETEEGKKGKIADFAILYSRVDERHRSAKRRTWH